MITFHQCENSVLKDMIIFKKASLRAKICEITDSEREGGGEKTSTKFVPQKGTLSIPMWIGK